jgi:hypothetical protein
MAVFKQTGTQATFPSLPDRLLSAPTNATHVAELAIDAMNAHGQANPFPMSKPTGELASMVLYDHDEPALLSHWVQYQSS